MNIAKLKKGQVIFSDGIPDPWRVKVLGNKAFRSERNSGPPYYEARIINITETDIEILWNGNASKIIPKSEFRKSYWRLKQHKDYR